MLLKDNIKKHFVYIIYKIYILSISTENKLSYLFQRYIVFQSFDDHWDKMTDTQKFRFRN
jgi:hypothetical protein